MTCQTEVLSMGHPAHQEDLGCTSTTAANHYLATLWDNSKSAEICPAVLMQNAFLVSSTDPDDAKMLLYHFF